MAGKVGKQTAGGCESHTHKKKTGLNWEPLLQQPTSVQGGEQRTRACKTGAWVQVSHKRNPNPNPNPDARTPTRASILGTALGKCRGGEGRGRGGGKKWAGQALELETPTPTPTPDCWYLVRPTQNGATQPQGEKKIGDHRPPPFGVGGTNGPHPGAIYS